MNRLLVTALLLLTPSGAAFADGGHQHHAAPAVPTLKNQVTTRINITEDAVVMTFGPIDLPSAHEGDLAASLPKHVFQLPEDKYLTGYKSEVFTAEGKPLPQNYLHHILLMDNDQPSVSCDGEPLFFAGAGLEMTEIGRAHV